MWANGATNKLFGYARLALLGAHARAPAAQHALTRPSRHRCRADRRGALARVQTESASGRAGGGRWWAGRALPSGYCVLTNLMLGRNGITDVGAVALAEAMPRSELLYVLNLANNEIGDDGAAAFARALRAGSDVYTLGLSWNRVGDAGAIALAEALAARRSAPSLELLALSGNRIGDAGGRALRDALDVHKTIGGVELTGNRMAPALPDEVNALLEARIQARDTRPKKMTTPISRRGRGSPATS